MSHRVFITRTVPASGPALLAEHGCRVAIHPHDRPPTADELRAGCAQADGVICMLNDAIDAALIEAVCPPCRVFANFAVGYNNIDLAAASRAGVCVTNTPGVLTETTADLAWALMLAAARRAAEADRHFRTGTWGGWAPTQFLGYDVHGATLGIIGAGRIGTAVARRAAGFKMTVLYAAHADKPDMQALDAERVSLDALLSRSDIVSLHVPLTPRTRHMLGAAELARMKPTAILINTARGPVVDESALVAALRSGRLAAAGLDVYEAEPTPAAGLLDCPTAVCLPHIGSASHATRERMSRMTAESVLAVFEGRRPANLVNTDLGA